MKQLETAEYVENRTGLSRPRIYEAARRGILPCVRIGRQIRFDPEKLEEWIAAGGQTLPGGWRHDEWRSE